MINIVGKDNFNNLLEKISEESKLIYIDIKKAKYIKRFGLSSAFTIPINVINEDFYKGSKNAITDKAKYDFNQLSSFKKFSIRFLSGKSLAKVIINFNKKIFKNINIEIVKIEKRKVIYHLHYFYLVLFPALPVILQSFQFAQGQWSGFHEYFGRSGFAWQQAFEYCSH